MYYNSLESHYEAAKKRYEDITAKIYSQDARNEQLELFIRTLEEQGVVTEFDETLWATLLESITVYGKEDIRVKFWDGGEGIRKAVTFCDKLYAFRAIIFVFSFFYCIIIK